MPKIFTMFSSFSMASLALPGMSGFVAELVVFFGLITSPKFMLMPKMLITFVMAIGMILTPIYLLSMLRQMFYGYKLFHVPNKNFEFGIYPDLVLSLSVDRVEKKVKNAEFVPFQFGFFLLCKYIANMKNQVLVLWIDAFHTGVVIFCILGIRYELHNDKFIINYNEMHFNESLYTLINMILLFIIESSPHIRGGDKKKQYSRISYKYRFSLEFNQSITKQESSFIFNKRNTKMIRNFFNTSMLGLVTSSNLIQIYFFWELVGMCSYLLIGFCACQKAFVTIVNFSLEFRDLFKIANNWIPNNGINSLLTTFFISLIGTITLFLGATLALAQRDIKRSLAYSTMSQWV
ncbi:hypothetical protein ACJX0J_000234 [Zea mays]